MGRKGSSAGPTGLVVVNKEPGWTSHDVVAKLRGVFGQRRTGHAGTLDPSATGVLLVGMGRATRLMRFLQDTTKRYDGTLVLGSTTTTLDADGEVTATFDMGQVDDASIKTQASLLTGEILQVPPMVSALKVDGVRLHELARQGVEIERAARPVTIESFTVTPTEDPMVFGFSVVCSSGTYVRSLVDDLGRGLGGGAHLGSLRRTAVGAFSLEDARTLDEIMAVTDRETAATSEALLTPAAAMRHLPSLVVDDEGAARVATGRSLEATSILADGATPVAVLDAEGALLAIYEPKAGALAASVVLAAG